MAFCAAGSPDTDVENKSCRLYKPLKRQSSRIAPCGRRLAAQRCSMDSPLEGQQLITTTAGRGGRHCGCIWIVCMLQRVGHSVCTASCTLALQQVLLY